MKLKFKPLSGARLVRKMTNVQLRELLFERFRMKPDQVYSSTVNRMARRNFARMNRQHGRGFTTPRRGRAHTAGSGTRTR